MPVQIQRQYAVLAAIQVDQRARGVKGQAARVGDPGIAAERPGEITPGAEAEDRPVAVAVGPAGTGDQDAHHDEPFNDSQRPAAEFGNSPA